MSRDGATDEELAVGEACAEELARRYVLDFCERMIPGFILAPHLRQMGELFESVLRGERRRVLITTFPGSGKSTFLQAAASFYLARHPRRKIIAASASAELAERNSRASRGFFTDPQWPFHKVALSKDTTAQQRWDTTEGGGFAAFGVGSQVTGWRANLFVLDDLQNDAGSEAERKGLEQWYREVLMPRLEPGGAIVWIQQRWGEDDLPGRVLASPGGADWEVVHLPAITAEGKSTWPERWPIEELEKQRTAMGSRAFECAFQGNPVPLDGNLIKAAWFQRYDRTPAEFSKVVCALDAAAKTGVRHDYSSIVKIGVTKNAYYVLDVWRDRVEFPALLRRVKLLETEEPKPSAIYVEDTSNAVALIQQLRDESTLAVVPITAKGSKESRVEGITGTLEAKRVFLPSEAPWLFDFERELLGFPLARHDDMVDAFTLALSKLSERRGELIIAEVGARYAPAIDQWGFRNVY